MSMSSSPLSRPSLMLLPVPLRRSQPPQVPAQPEPAQQRHSQDVVAEEREGDGVQPGWHLHGVVANLLGVVGVLEWQGVCGGGE